MVPPKSNNPSRRSSLHSLRASCLPSPLPRELARRLGLHICRRTKNLKRTTRYGFHLPYFHHHGFHHVFRHRYLTVMGFTNAPIACVTTSICVTVQLQVQERTEKGNWTWSALRTYGLGFWILRGPLIISLSFVYFEWLLFFNGKKIIVKANY